MNFLPISPVTIALLSLVSVISLLMWWIVRLKKRRFWLPLLAILNKTSQKKRRFILSRPPIVPFLSLLLLTLTVLTLALGPYQNQPVARQDRLPKVFVLLDLSPSVFSVVTVQELQDLARKILRNLIGRARVSAGTTATLESQVIESEDDIERFVLHLAETRFGAKLGSSLQALHASSEESDFFDLVISDRDEFSWEDIDLDSTFTRSRLLFYDLTKSKILGQNIFIDGITWLKNLNQDESSYSLSLLRGRADGKVADGQLSFFDQDDRPLAKVPFRFNPSQKSLELVVILPNFRGNPKEAKKNSPEDHYLKVVLETRAENLLKSDDFFFAPAQAGLSQVALIAAPEGEGWLQDSTYDLQAVFNVLGYQSRRFERATDLTEAEAYDLVVLALPERTPEEIDELCPSTVGPAREIWLYPSRQNQGRDSICACFVRLLDNRQTEIPSYCRQNNTPDLLGSSLSSIGGKQILGSLADKSGALAYRLEKSDGSGVVLGFLHSLIPQAPLSRSLLPKALALILGGGDLSAKPKLGTWLRLDHIKSAKADLSPIDLKRSNIPLGESLMEERRGLDALRLYQLDSEMGNGSSSISDFSLSEKESIKLIRFFFLVLALSMLLEILYSCRSWLAALLTFLFFFLNLGSDLAHANQIHFYQGDPTLKELHFSNLKADVEKRTSLNLEAVASKESSKSFLGKPLFWLGSMQAAVSLTSNLVSSDLAAWLNRGGLLVVQDEGVSTERLDNWVTAVFKTPLSERKQHSGFKPIGPDHELLRSFHLMEVLPSCASANWLSYEIEGRLAILIIPYQILRVLSDGGYTLPGCTLSREVSVRAFINILMVALTTDYKKDQLQLREILKRLER